VAPAGAVFTLDSAARPPPENPNAGIQRPAVEVVGSARIVVAFSPGVPSAEAVPAPARRALSAWA